MDRIEKIMSSINKFSKTFALLSSIAGISMIIYFLIRTNSPLPPIDASFGLTITIFMFYIFFFLVICFSASLFPALTTPAKSEIAKRAYTFMSKPIHTYGMQDRFLVFYSRAKVYLAFFLPFLSLLLILTWQDLEGGAKDSLGLILLSVAVFVFSAAISIIGIYRSTKSISCATNVELTDFCISLVGSNIFSIIWITIFYVFFKQITKEIIGDVDAKLEEVIFVLVSIIFHFVLCSSAPSLRSLTFTSVLLGYCLIALSPGASVSTAYVLQRMGSGGSSAVSIIVKEYNDEGRTRLKKYDGCLMFSTASFLVFRIPRNTEFKSSYCDIQRGDFYSEGEKKIPSDVQIYSRSDIHRIGGIE